MAESVKPPKRTGRKILLGIFIFLVLAALAFQVYIDRYLEPVIHKRLETLIVSGSDSLYTFQVDKINVSFWKSSVEVQNLRIHVDSIHYAQREKASTLPTLTFDINLKLGSIAGIGLLPILFDKKINIESIRSKNADLTLSRHFRKADKKIKTVDEPLWKLIRPDIKAINIDKIVLDDINFSYTNADSAKAFKWKFEHCSTIIDNTRLDSASASDKTRILFSKNISVQFNDIKLQTGDGMYAVEAKKLWYSSEAKNVELEDFKYHPVMGQQAFYAKVGIDKDRFNLDFPKTRLVNFQLPQWINSNILAIDTVELTSPQINVYKDKTFKPDVTSKVGRYPHQQLDKLPFVLQVGQIRISDAGVSYTEKNPKSGMEGKLMFQKLHGTIKNVTNDADLIRNNPRCVADINGFFMQKSPLHAVFTFRLDQISTGGFEVNTDIARMEGAQLNPLTVPLAQASIKSLSISELHYHIRGNDHIGSGDLTLLYKGLELDLTKKPDDDGKIKKRKFLSFLVNKLVVFPDNPLNGKERKAVNIQTIRDPQKSFFNLIWKTLFNSFKEITIRIDRLKEDKTLKPKKK